MGSRTGRENNTGRRGRKKMLLKKEAEKKKERKKLESGEVGTRSLRKVRCRRKTEVDLTLPWVARKQWMMPRSMMPNNTCRAKAEKKNSWKREVCKFPAPIFFFMTIWPKIARFRPGSRPHTTRVWREEEGGYKRDVSYRHLLSFISLVAPFWG